jgi:hypothetical protein
MLFYELICKKCDTLHVNTQCLQDIEDVYFDEVEGDIYNDVEKCMVNTRKRDQNKAFVRFVLFVCLLGHFCFVLTKGVSGAFAPSTTT